jgi:hypothetical protein
MSQPKPAGRPPRGVPLPKPAGTLNNNADTVPAAVSEVPDDKKEEVDAWLKELYDPKYATPDYINQMWEALAYKGFDRGSVIKQLKRLTRDMKIIIELIVVTALRGPQAASNIKLSNGKTPKEMGVPASGAQGTKILTLNKILSATADLAAFYLKKMNVPKRIITSPLPGWLQFPSAGSIKLPKDLREQHLEFASKFSSLIGGIFQEQIYSQMENNAYLDEKLRLFD